MPNSLVWLELKLISKNINNLLVFYVFLLSCGFLFAITVPSYTDFAPQIGSIILQVILYLSIFIYAGRIFIDDQKLGLLDMVQFGNATAFITAKIWVLTLSLILATAIIMPILALILSIPLDQCWRLIIANLFFIPTMIYFLSITNLLFLLW